MYASFRAGIRRSRPREGMAIAVSLALHLVLATSSGFERSENALRPAATPLVVTLEPQPSAAPAPLMPEASVTVPITPTRTPRPAVRTTVRAGAATEPGAPAQSAFGAEKSSLSEARDDGSLPRPSPVYYTAHELDVYPTLKESLNINWEGGLEPGWLTVGLTLDETGVVEEISILDASPDRGAEAALREALHAARFTAALKDGRAVKSRILVRVRFGADSLARGP